MEISNLVDSAFIRQIGDQFCKGNSVYMYCLDDSFQCITDSYGSEQEKEYICDQIPLETYQKVTEKIRSIRVENLVEGPLTPEYAKVYAVVISFSGKPLITWIVTAFLEEKDEGAQIPDYMMTTTEKRLFQSMEFLVQLSRHVFAAKMNEQIAQEAMQKSISTENTLRSQLSMSKSMTRILKFLESEVGFTDIINAILEEACKCLDIYVGVLVQENKDHNVDMLCRYCVETPDRELAFFQNVKKEDLPYYTGKTYMISSDTEVSGEFDRFFRDRSITAGVFMPVLNRDETVMYLCFCAKKEERNWSMDEIKFLNDVKSIVQGIFTKRIAKNSLASSYVALEEILENTGCGIYVLDPGDGSVLYMNQKFKELFSHTIELGKLDEMIQAQKELGNSFCENYIALEDRWMDENKTTISWVDGRQVSLCTVYDVTDKKEYQQEIENQANNDFLTGLYNRMRCEQDLLEKIEHCMMHGTEGALLFLDLDDFKHINEGLGHQYGDVLLKAISNSLRRVRGVEDSCYRMGGDEFIIIVDDLFFPELQRICNDIESIFARPWFLKGEDYYCTMSMGIVCFPSDADTTDDVIRKADLALFAAKRRGKNSIEFYNDAESDSPYRRLDLEKNIRKATMSAMNEFEVYYQPIMDVSGEDSVCCGAEALARWNSAELGFISPGDFIPLAEYLGLINPIGDHVLMEAAKRCKHWNDMGHPEYKVNVNLSVVQLLQNDIVKRIEQVIKETRINPRHLMLEVTESLAIDDIKRMIMVLSQIKQLGVGVALDDFGTGYSSLNHIRELPIDTIKIDRCFIEHIVEDDYSEAFVKMITQLAEALHVNVCVEGVENDQQYEMVKQAKAQMIQGYFFGKPMRLEVFEREYL